MAEAPTQLAHRFPAAARADWLALAERALKGAPIETLQSRTGDGVVIEPLYAPDRAVTAEPFDPAPRPAGRSWEIRVPVRHPQIARANAETREALEGGAASVVCAIDPDGESGVQVGGAEDMARLLDGVLTDLAPVALDAGFLGAHAAQWLANAAKASPIAPLAFHLDPLGAFVRSGASPGPIESHVAACAGVAARLAAPHPKASLFLASGVAVHEAGAGDAAEIAFAAASALAYARALEVAGLPPAEGLARIVIGLAVDGDPLVSVSKLRAARMVWRRITLACGAPCAARIEARSSRRMLTRADPWTNLVRLTAAGFAAAVGGADAIVLGAFTDAVSLPASLARRLARDTGLILMEEAHVGAVVDPAGGGWAFESLSAAIARAAWESLRAIEAAGGAARALSTGLIAEWAKNGRHELEKKIKSGELKIIGVTDFRLDKSEAVEIETAEPIPTRAPDPRLPGPDSHCSQLTPILLEELAR